MTSPSVLGRIVPAHRKDNVVSLRLLRWVLSACLAASWVSAGPLEETLAKVATSSLKPGFGILLFDARGVVWSHCEGLASEERGVPFTEDTTLRLGATSELFTVVLAQQQIEADRLDPGSP